MRLSPEPDAGPRSPWGHDSCWRGYAITERRSAGGSSRETGLRWAIARYRGSETAWVERHA